MIILDAVPSEISLAGADSTKGLPETPCPQGWWL